MTVQTPAINHLTAVSDELRVLTEFCDWLESIGVEFDCRDSDITRLDDQKPSKLVDRFLEIDRRQIESDRRQLLQSIRDKNESDKSQAIAVGRRSQRSGIE